MASLELRNNNNSGVRMFVTYQASQSLHQDLVGCHLKCTLHVVKVSEFSIDILIKMLTDEYLV